MARSLCTYLHKYVRSFEFITLKIRAHKCTIFPDMKCFQTFNDIGIVQQI